MENKKSFLKIVMFILITLLLCGSFNYVIDPYFHYHQPLSYLQYPINNERYQNNGLLRNFEYNAIVTGTSMCENFKTSEINDAFDVETIPLYCSGGSFKEINDQLIEAFKYNSDIKLVIRGLDYSMIALDADFVGYELPDYLNDNNLVNDINYLLNKDTLLDSLSVIRYTLEGNKTTSFDNVSNWMDEASWGKDVLDSIYSRPEKSESIDALTDEEIETIKENVDLNILKLIKDHPETEFYYFLTPYSIYYFDSLNQSGSLEKTLEIEKILIEELIEQDNLHLFSFFLCDESIITNLVNYRDITHYCEWINSNIVNYMKNDEYCLTKDNYEDYLENEKQFFENYDYVSLFE